MSMMKVINSKAIVNGGGVITLMPQNPDDLWFLYNHISQGDIVSAKTLRKVQNTESRKSTQCIRTKLGISVVKTEYDQLSSTLRISGKITSDDDSTGMIMIGAFHTLEIKLQQTFDWSKDVWKQSLLHDLLKKPVSKTTETVSSTSTGKKATKTTHETDGSEGSKSFNRFKDMLYKEESRVCYGHKGVEMANEMKAIDTLFVTDGLFRSSDVAVRKKYDCLVEVVKKAGGTAHVFNTAHECSKQLEEMSGVAAILRFPIPNLEDLQL